MRIGLMGGTFDPVHLGHLIMAEWTKSELLLDRIVFIPSGRPPHKESHELTPAPVRRALLEAALAHEEDYDISEVELGREGISYTIDTVRSLLDDHHYKNAELFMIIGADTLLELHTWKHPETVLSLVQMVVCLRPGFPLEKADGEFLSKVNVIPFPFIDISSSRIRERVRQGKSIHFLVPAAVEEYIHKTGLYRPE